MMTVAAMANDRGLGRVGLLVIALLRKACTAVNRYNGAAIGAQLGGMRHRPRRQAEDEEKTDYDVKPPFHRAGI